MRGCLVNYYKIEVSVYKSNMSVNYNAHVLINAFRNYGNIYIKII